MIKINVIDGVTPLGSDTFNTMQDNIEAAINDAQNAVQANVDNLKNEKDNDLSALDAALKAYAEKFVRDQRRGSIQWEYVQKDEQLLLDGTTKNRADYIDLWNWANTNGLVVTEAEWANNKGKFSSGDGSTTFRLPDWISGNRFPRAAGGTLTVGTLQEDEIKQHNHASGMPFVRVGSGSSGWSANVLNSSMMTGADQPYTTAVTGNAGGTETRPKAVAALPCIWY